jgi:hypothetical protein
MAVATENFLPLSIRGGRTVKRKNDVARGATLLAKNRSAVVPCQPFERPVARRRGGSGRRDRLLKTTTRHFPAALSAGSIQGAMGMNRTFKAAVAALMLAVSFAGSVAAGPVEDKALAVAAYKRGDYATALLLLRPLADRGDSEAHWTMRTSSEN